MANLFLKQASNFVRSSIDYLFSTSDRCKPDISFETDISLVYFLDNIDWFSYKSRSQVSGDREDQAADRREANPGGVWDTDSQPMLKSYIQKPYSFG